MTKATQKLQSPKLQPFYRGLATSMTLFCVGHHTWWGYTNRLNKIAYVNRQFINIFAPACVVSEIIYLILNYKSLPLSTILIIFIIFPVDCITNLSIRLAKMKSFENLLKMFMDKIHLYNYIGNSEFAKDKTIKTEKYTRLAGYFLLLFLMADWIAWYVTPIWHLMQNIEEVRNQTIILQTAPRLWMPFDYKYNIRNWSLVHIINAYIGFSACGIFITFNILSFIFIFHLIGHVQILKYRFRTEFKNPMNNDATKETLISLIKYHNFIVEVFKDTQTAFGPNVTANYFHNLLCDSLLMYGIMLGDKKDIVIFGLMFLVFMGGLILMSLIMEEIRRESVDLADVIYSIPWEKMSISNQKNVTMILARAQPPLEFISAGGLRAGVRPAISIIKSTFSYYVMLKSAMNVEK